MIVGLVVSNIQPLYDTFVYGSSPLFTLCIVILTMQLFLLIESFCIPHLRKLYFEIKDRVFGKTRFGLGCDTNALEMILKREFKDRRLTPVPQGTK